jgi:hypothetical protein
MNKLCITDMSTRPFHVAQPKKNEKGFVVDSKKLIHPAANDDCQVSDAILSPYSMRVGGGGSGDEIFPPSTLGSTPLICQLSMRSL